MNDMEVGEDYMTPITWRVLRVIKGKALSADVITDKKIDAIQLVRRKDYAFCDQFKFKRPTIYTAFMLRRVNLGSEE